MAKSCHLRSSEPWLSLCLVRASNCDHMIRRLFLRKLAAVPLFAAAAAVPAATTNSSKLKILMKSAWGSDDQRRPRFLFCMAMYFLKPATMSRYSFLARPYP